MNLKRCSLRLPKQKTMDERIAEAASGIRAMHYTDEALTVRFENAAEEMENALRTGGAVTELFVTREAYRTEMQARGLKEKLEA